MNYFSNLYYDWLYKETENVELFSFNGYTVVCKVVYVYDGIQFILYYH